MNHTHGKTGTRIYKIWEAMLARCYNQHNNRYKNYGAKGITVCEDWFKFENFYADMGDDKGLSIDRIENDKGYSKTNCRWATMKEQQNNKTNNVRLAFNNKIMNVVQWADELGIPAKRIYSRVKAGWPIERVLSL